MLFFNCKGPRDFPVGPVVKTPSFHHKGPDSIPGQATKTSCAITQPKKDNNHDDGDDDDDICKGPVVSRRITNSAVWYHDSHLRCQQLYSTLFHIIVRVNRCFVLFCSQKRQIMCSCYYDNAFDLLDSLKGFGEHFEKCCPIE